MQGVNGWRGEGLEFGVWGVESYGSDIISGPSIRSVMIFTSAHEHAVAALLTVVLIISTI